jgi:hypothetical protein
MKILEESADLQRLHEMFVDVRESLPTEVENSIYYPKLKHLLFSEINDFCKEKIELKKDLHGFRELVGTVLEESDIRNYLEKLKTKYNMQVNNIGLDYHIEVTRIDFGVPVFVIIKRDFIYMKKFVFRFKKNIATGLEGLTTVGTFKNSIVDAITKQENK